MQTFDPRPYNTPSPAALLPDADVAPPSQLETITAAHARIASLATGQEWLRLIRLIQQRPLGGALTAQCWQRWGRLASLLDELLDGDANLAARVVELAEDRLGAHELLLLEAPVELLARIAEELI